MDFNVKLRELRMENNLTQKQIAEMLNLDRSTYTQYELGKRSPTIETLARIASIFNCSTDYLLGKTELREPLEIIIRDAGVEYDPDHSIDRENMPTVLKELGVEYIQLAEDIKAEDLTPDDIRELMHIIKKHKKSSN